jgi:coatomer subunit gamma
VSFSFCASHPSSSSSIFLSSPGVFRGGAEVLLRAKLALADGVTMQLTVRSTDSDVAEIVSSAIG